MAIINSKMLNSIHMKSRLCTLINYLHVCRSFIRFVFFIRNFVNSEDLDFCPGRVPPWTESENCRILFLRRPSYSKVSRVVCPNFVMYKIWFLAAIVIERSVYSFRMVFYYSRSMPTASSKCVNLEWRREGRVSKVRSSDWQGKDLERVKSISQIARSQTFYPPLWEGFYPLGSGPLIVWDLGHPLGYGTWNKSFSKTILLLGCREGVG